MACVRFSCRKIVCVGYNYVEHNKEIGNKIPQEPVIFLKPSTSLIAEGQLIRLPPNAKEIEHEVELGVVIGKEITKADVFQAKEAIKGYVLALDMTDRKKQFALMKQKLSFDLAKGFDTSCPISRFIDVADIADSEVSSFTMAAFSLLEFFSKRRKLDEHYHFEILHSSCKQLLSFDMSCI